MSIIKSRQGTILILALWALAFLTVFAISIGYKIQQKIILASRLEKRAQLYYAAEAGIKESIALLKKGHQQIKDMSKVSLYNNPDLFQAVPVGSFVFDVRQGDVYGIVDEERKLNINTADQPELTNLLHDVTAVSKETAEDIAKAIIDWRTMGESEIGSFFSEEYYDHLKFPYKEKKSDFETLDELLLVKGITPAIYKEILPFVTIYGNGKVNINSVSPEVLTALGVSESAARKIVFGRRGPDGKEATDDDIVFSSGPEMIDALQELLKGRQGNDDQEDVALLSQLFMEEKLGAESAFFMIQSRGYSNSGTDSIGNDLKVSRENKVITCVFDLNSAKIQYWREEN